MKIFSCESGLADNQSQVVSLCNTETVVTAPFTNRGGHIVSTCNRPLCDDHCHFEGIKTIKQ